MYKRFPIHSLLLFSVVTSGFVLFNERKVAENPALVKGVAVVELFTSEGCSSCPPADKLLRKMDAENKNVYVLSYHVDYWNRLGWKDPYSQAAFTARQQHYANRFALKSIYTPQVVVNGAEEFVGSDEPRLRSSITERSTVDHLDLQVKRTGAATLSISYTLSHPEPVFLHLALVQPQATTVVKRGENGGRTLHHVNVVRDFKTTEPQGATGSAEITIPADLQSTACDVILFAQQKKSDRITAAQRATVPLFAN